MPKDLGTTYDYPEGLDKPIMEKPPKKHYPTVHLETDERLDIPEEGTITFTYKKKSGEWHEKDDGKKRYECTLKLKSLVRAHKGKKAKVEAKLPVEETEEALDKIAESY